MTAEGLQLFLTGDEHSATCPVCKSGNVTNNHLRERLLPGREMLVDILRGCASFTAELGGKEGGLALFNKLLTSIRKSNKLPLQKALLFLTASSYQP